jgi:lipopolysaccharide export system permease protein
MTGCGVGPLYLYRPFVTLALALAAVTAALAFQIGPWAGREAEQLLKDARRLIQYTPFEAGQFKQVADNRGVFYTARMDAAADTLDTVFARINEKRGPSIVTARRGSQTLDPQTGERLVTLEQGYRYSGVPGRAEYDIVKFDKLTTRVAPPELIERSGKRGLQETSALLGSDDPQDQAELAWRLAAPVSVLILALLAVPLAHTSPRSGRYGRLILGILLYLAYANLIALGQSWMAKGYVSPIVGLWWVHAMVAALAVALISRRLGWGLRHRHA